MLAKIYNHLNDSYNNQNSEIKCCYYHQSSLFGVPLENRQLA